MCHMRLLAPLYFSCLLPRLDPWLCLSPRRLCFAVCVCLQAKGQLGCALVELSAAGTAVVERDRLEAVLRGQITGLQTEVGVISVEAWYKACTVLQQ